MRAAELCAGYGGLALAVEQVFGAETAWVSEFEEAPSRILAHHWPTVPNHGDMTKIDWAAVEPVDIISGGTPCQDLSGAGRRKGMTEGTRSNLWVQMRESIATIKPTYVVWENVRGAYSACASSEMGQCPGCVDGREPHKPLLRALGRVLGDLSDLGYDCQWRGLRAADVGAPHGRFRVFVLATHRDHLRVDGARERAEQNWRGQPANRRISTTNTEGDERRKPNRDSGPAPADPNNPGSQGQHHSEGTSSTERHGHAGEGIDWGQYTWAIRRWEAMRGAAPSPVELSPTGKPRLSANFGEWMMGLPAGWITDVPGVRWGDALKAAGNGVVPQQAIAALRDMLAAQQGLEVAA